MSGSHRSIYKLSVSLSSIVYRRFAFFCCLATEVACFCFRLFVCFSRRESNEVGREGLHGSGRVLGVCSAF